MRPAALVVALSLAAAACATNPVTGRRELSLMSEDQEIQIGQEQDAQVRKEMGVYADRELQQYVSDMGLRLARVSERPNLPWHFTVVDVPAVNAFALPGGSIERDGYLKRIDGLAYGDNPDQGVVRGSTFLHASLRIAIEFPPGWDVNNGQAQIVAKESGLNALVVLEAVHRPVGRTIQDVALRSMEGAGFRALDGARTTINGLDAFVGTYEGSLRDMGRVTIRAAHVVHERDVFFIAGLAPQPVYQRVEPNVVKTINSFRPMTRAEAEGIRPNRIDLYTAREGDSWQSIAERQGHGVVKASTLAIMNGYIVSDQPRPGERLKIVVAG